MLHPNRLPISVLTRYIAAEFARFFALILTAFIGIYLIVDFFERLDSFLKHSATAWAAVRYLAFKIPLIVTQMVPPAVLAATLISVGMLSRRNELIALRSSGVSIYRVARPLLILAGAISLAVLVWDETVVPFSTHNSQQVNLLEIRRQERRTILSDREIWYRSADAFYNIDHIDAARQTLYGLSIYRLGGDFALRSTTEVTTARWVGDRWEVSGAVERRITPSGDVEFLPVDTNTVLQREKPEDFLEVYRQPEEMSYTMLSQRINALSRKGIDASTYLVDLHLKLAVPFMSVVLAALAIPIAGRSRRQNSIALTIGIGIAVGFSYWVILALGMSLGRSGALPAAVAAWSANAICTLLSVVLFLSAE